MSLAAANKIIPVGAVRPKRIRCFGFIYEFRGAICHRSKRAAFVVGYLVWYDEVSSRKSYPREAFLSREFAFIAPWNES
jgi:hypothetical protein